MKAQYKKQIIELVEHIEDDRHLRYIYTLMKQLIAKSTPMQREE